ncbi:hypothetical protein N9L13_08105 [Flavobacteriales bacterium]|nr:hypothetical protein [Flavobacteriales bacterium]
MSCWLVLSLNAQDIYGCTSPFAPNYNPAANINDYSCDYDVPQLLADGYCIQELLDGDVWYYDFQGIEYGGGYIRHVSESAGKALISSGTNVGSFEWGCYPQNVSTSTSAWTGETNTLAIVSAGCTDVADAAIAAYQFSQNGYNDWFLPSKGDAGSGDCGTCGAWGYNYWSSSQYSSDEAWALTTSTSTYYSDAKYFDKNVVPVRYIDLEDDCIGPASCQDWVQEGQGGPPPGVSCDYPLFNCESVDDPIWNDMATGLYPADTSYLEVGISSDASVLLHASESFTVDGTAQTLISLEIDSIADLPPGLTLDDSGLPLMLSPDEGAVSTSCFALEGVPSDQGTYTITVYSTATIAVFGFEIPVDGVQFHHTIEVLETTSEILGCTYADALNFNPYANLDDGSCEFEPFAGCESDTDGDGVCDEDEVPGCITPLACNYDSAATDDDGSCTYAEAGIDCDGICLLDSDGDGICDEFELVGCTASNACNYDSSATDDDGSCDFCSCAAAGNPVAGYTLSIEVHAVDVVPGYTTYRVYQNLVNADDFVLSIYGNSDDPLSISTTTGYYNSSFGGITAASINAALLGFFPDLGADSWVTIGIDSQPTENQTEISTVESQDQPWASSFASGSSLDGQDIVMDDFAGGAWYVVGGPNGLGGDDNRVLLMQLSTMGEFSGVINTQILENGSADDNDIRNTYEFSGTGEFSSEGFACGCLDEAASNYDGTADYEDGSCDYSVPGCIAPQACNYDSAATDDDGSCTYAEAGLDCDGNCLVDTDGDQICDQDEITGCQDNAACNYDATATDDGYCDYPEANYDCDGNCLNDVDQDGICDEFEVAGCTDSSACNYNAAATNDDSSCTYAGAGYDCAGDCLVDSDGDDICDQDEVVGCQDNAACNYDATATDDGYCDYPEANYDCDGNCLNDSDNDSICDSEEVNGCMNSSACNYSSDATDEDGSCLFPSGGFDCEGNSFCGDGTIWSDDFAVCLASICSEDINGDGVVGTADLLALLSVYGEYCPE